MSMDWSLDKSIKILVETIFKINRKEQRNKINEQT